MARIISHLVWTLFMLTYVTGLTTLGGTSGKDFYVGILKPYDMNAVNNITLYITSAATNGHAHIQVPHLGINMTASFNRSFEFNLPKTIIQSANDTVQRRGIHLITDTDVSLLVSTAGANDISETFLVLPRNMLSKSYIISSFKTTTYYKKFNSNLLIVAVENDTIVHMISSSNPTKMIKSVSMNKSDTYLLASVVDLSGILVQSNKQIAVLSGHEATGIPYNCAYGRFLVEQLLPLELFGRNFIVPPVAPKSGYMVRIYSSEPNTTLNYINSSSTETRVLALPGQFHEILSSSEPLEIFSNKPSQVMLYSTCYSYNSANYGDSFATIIPAIQQYNDTYNFNVPAIFKPCDHYLALMSERLNFDASLLLDGQHMPNSIYNYTMSSSSSNFSVYIYKIFSGAHTLEHLNGYSFGALLYGFSRKADGAYGNIVGMNAVMHTADCELLVPPTNGIVTTPNGTKYPSQAEYICSNGYMLHGVSTRKCNASGIWTGAASTCEAKDCGKLVSPTNGIVTTPNGTKYPSHAEYVCNDGYVLHGVSTRKCNASGIWTGTASTCVAKDCGTLISPTNGVVTTPNGTKYPGNAEYVCNDGYILHGVSTRKCNASGIWTGTASACEVKYCGKLVSPTNGQVTTPNGTKYPSHAEYICDDGYMLHGVSKRKCNASGIWTGTASTCEAKDCGKLVSLTNGKVTTPNGTEYPSYVEYICDDGYMLHGISTRKCNASGNWTGTVPTCEAKDCGKLVTPTNGVVTTPNGTKYPSYAEYVCNDGYMLHGVSTRKCNASGIWTGTASTCEAKDCGKLLSQVNGTVTTPNGTTYPNHAEYVCDEGYVLHGNSTRKCNTSGIWTGTASTCEAKDCGKLLSLVNGTVTTPNGTTYPYHAEYVCDEGYVLHGNSTRKCNTSGIWTGTASTCEVNDHSTTCLQCNDIYHPSLCNTIRRCSPGQVCFIEKFTRHYGEVLYNTGCTDSKQCSLSNQNTGKSSAYCIECCSSQLCNFNGCGSQGLPSRLQRGPVCYDCGFTVNMTECHRIRLCKQFEVCSIEKYDWGGLYDQYMTECRAAHCLTSKRSNLLHTRSRMVKRAIPVCQTCCENDLCNFNCSVTPQSGTGTVLVG